MRRVVSVVMDVDVDALMLVLSNSFQDEGCHDYLYMEPRASCLNARLLAN